MHVIFSQPHIPYLIYFFLGLNLTYFIGHLIYCFIVNNGQSNSLQIFSKLSFGLLFIVFSSAIYWTIGNTVFIGWTIPFYFLIKNTKFKWKYETLQSKQLILLQLFAVPILCLQYLFYAKWGSMNLLPIDINNHAEISFYLKNGFECKYAALNSLEAKNIPTKSPYHYIDNWITLFFNTIFKASKIGYTMVFVVFPLLITTFYSGIYSVLQNVITNKYLAFTFSTIFLFLGPIDLNFTRELFNVGNLLDSNTVIFENSGFFFNTLLFSYHGQKHIPFYILGCWLLISYLKSKNKNLIILFSFAPIINIGLAPGIIGGIGIYSVLKVIRTRNLKETFYYVLPVILTATYVVVFYKFNGGYDIENQTKINTFHSDLNIKGEISKVIYKIVYSSLFLFFIYSIFLIPLFNKKKCINLKDLLAITACILLVGLGTRVLFEGFNTAQFLSYILPLVNILLIYLASFYLQARNLKSFIIRFLMVIFCFVNFKRTYYHTTNRREIAIEKIHDTKFIAQISRLIHKTPNPKIGYLLSQQDFKIIPPGFWYGYYPCEFLLTIDCFQIYSLNFPNQQYPEDSQSSNNFSPNHLRYILPHYMNYKQYEQALPIFIKEKKIDYIITKKSSRIPNTLKSIIADSIIDCKSGDVLYILFK